MEIPEIKRQLTLASVINHYGLKADKTDRICCPFHKDKTPSMQLYWKTHTAYCFSSNCSTHGKSMDVIDFIKNMEKCNKHQAILKAQEILKGSVPTPNPVTATPAKTQLGKKVHPSLASSGQAITRTAVLQKMFSYFKNAVSNSQPAQDYLKNRTLDYTRLEVGFNSGQFHHGDRISKELIESCKHYGLLTESSKHNQNGQTYTPFGKYGIVFPLKNRENQITAMYYRSTINNDDKKHYYLKDRQGLYPGYPKPETKQLILCEAIIDTATLLQIPAIADHYSLLACYGTNGLTEEHTGSIKELKELEEIIFAFDNDEAGKEAVKKYAEYFSKELPDCKLSTLELPCKDVNDTAQAHSSEIFTHLIEQRTSFSFSIEKKKNDSDEKKSPDVTVMPIAEQNTALNGWQTPKLNTTNPDQLHYNTSELLITLLGGISLQNLDRLRVTLYLRRNPHLSPVYSVRQTIDLYHHDALEKFTRQASERLETGTSMITEAIASLTEELEQYRLNEIEKKKAVSKKKPRKVLTPEEKEQAINNLERKDLLAWTMNTVIKTGIIGEKENAGILFYGMTSRLLENPVSIITLSSSGTGKSYLMERIAQCFPEDVIIENTHLTDNSLYYFKQEELKHKIMLIEDMDGAQNVEYAIRELISKKYITKTVVRKDSKGQLHTEQHRVEGPVAFFGCTTREKLYDDNANRVIPIYLNTGKEQDKAVMNYHKQVKAGLINTQEEQQIREELKNMQSLLKPYKIINPYAPMIDLPTRDLKPRRTLGIVFSFIEAITLYHQYSPSQEEHKEKGFLETHPDHIAYAFELLKETLFRKSDELNASVRNFLESLKSFMDKEKKQSFFANEIRKPLNLHPRTLRKYLYELHLFGYVRIAGGNKYRKGFEYELSPQAKEESLRTSIDRHIAEMMEKIRASHKKRKKQ